MFYIFNNKNKCVSSCSFPPNKEDLESRQEFYIENEEKISLGSIYESGVIVENKQNQIIDYELRAKGYRNFLRNQLDIYLLPSSTINDMLVTEEQKDILIQDSVLLARWPSNEGWPYIPLPILSPLCNELLNNPVWEF